MIDEICKPDACTGCSACAQTCPKQCIAMQPDEEGFLRPAIDQGVCVHCGKCRKVCPINQPSEDDGTLPMAFAAKHLDDNVRDASSSGGIFSAFASHILGLDGAVIAAGFDDNFRVIHKVCTCEDSLDELRRSKYVQSDINGMYREAKQRLEKGQKVLFCGTPCQIGGLIAFLGKPYSNLYTVDFICHGVPSPKAWERYKDYINAKSDNLKTVSMRSKKYGWKNFSMDIEYRDGGIHLKKVNEDFYLRSFLMDLDLRPSCYECQFKQIHRVSDITIADYWGAEETCPEWNDDTGISLVLVHSPKGTRLIEAVRNSSDVISVPFSVAVASNPSISKSVKQPPLRKAFMRDLDKLPFDKLHEKYCGSGIVAKLRREISKFQKN